ncbi:hypothetical protein RHMOL_Rhmol13G0025400 [Rhododendron molle]|uniref:Uncharacterized protein n=1 Tax=Rhododendron molle TaxID=49168 RepID=A0ACC0L278_RHOML|nr:hypothetical protein RHMOL_Rhmol13G0025400 [Rhododendron molle]
MLLQKNNIDRLSSCLTDEMRWAIGYCSLISGFLLRPSLQAFFGSLYLLDMEGE